MTPKLGMGPEVGDGGPLASEPVILGMDRGFIVSIRLGEFNLVDS